MKKFRGRMLIESEIARFWSVVKKDVSTLGYDVDRFPTPQMAVFCDVSDDEFDGLWAKHATVGDVAQKEIEEYGKRVDPSKIDAFTHTHFHERTKTFTSSTVILIRKWKWTAESFDRIIRHEMTQLFELHLGLQCGTLVKRLDLMGDEST